MEKIEIWITWETRAHDLPKYGRRGWSWVWEDISKVKESELSKPQPVWKVYSSYRNRRVTVQKGVGLGIKGESLWTGLWDPRGRSERFLEVGEGGNNSLSGNSHSPSGTRRPTASLSPGNLSCGPSLRLYFPLTLWVNFGWGAQHLCFNKPDIAKAWKIAGLKDAQSAEMWPPSTKLTWLFMSFSRAVQLLHM